MTYVKMRASRSNRYAGVVGVGGAYKKTSKSDMKLTKSRL